MEELIQQILIDNYSQYYRLANKFVHNERDAMASDFKEITPDRNFYFNEAGDLVIVFNEYDAAPGYMGNPEFIIPKDV